MVNKIGLTTDVNFPCVIPASFCYTPSISMTFKKLFLNMWLAKNDWVLNYPIETQRNTDGIVSLI